MREAFPQSGGDHVGLVFSAAHADGFAVDRGMAADAPGARGETAALAVYSGMIMHIIGPRLLAI